MNWMTLIFALFLIVFEAVPEGLALGGHKTIAECVEFVYLSGVTLGLFAWLKGIRNYEYARNFIKTIIGYLLLRYAIFDVILNKSAGLPIDFIGSTKGLDFVLSWVKGMWGMSPIWFTRAIAGFWGLSWLLARREH